MGSNSVTLKVITRQNAIQNSLKFDINHPGLTGPIFQNLAINYTQLLKSFKFGSGSRMSDKKNLSYLNLNISRTKNGINKL